MTTSTAAGEKCCITKVQMRSPTLAVTEKQMQARSLQGKLDYDEFVRVIYLFFLYGSMKSLVFLQSS